MKYSYKKTYKITIEKFNLVYRSLLYLALFFLISAIFTSDILIGINYILIILAILCFLLMGLLPKIIN